MWGSLKLRAAGAGGALALVGSQVYAAVPVAVTDAIEDMQADALTVAGLVLVAIVAVLAFKFMRKGF